MIFHFVWETSEKIKNYERDNDFIFEIKLKLDI